jgi:hypothetical protein
VLSKLFYSYQSNKVDQIHVGFVGSNVGDFLEGHQLDSRCISGVTTLKHTK